MLSLRSIVAVVALGACNAAWADLELPCQYVTTAPVVDGRGDDPAWAETQSVTTIDAVAEIDHQIRCAYTAGRIFIQVRFSDPDENREHKPLVWNTGDASAQLSSTGFFS